MPKILRAQGANSTQFMGAMVGPSCEIVYSDAAASIYLPIPKQRDGCTEVYDVITQIAEAFDATTPSLKIGIAKLTGTGAQIASQNTADWTDVDDDGFLTDTNIKGAGWSTAASETAPIIKTAKVTGTANPYGNGFSVLPASAEVQYAIKLTWSPGTGGTAGKITIKSLLLPSWFSIGGGPAAANATVA